MTITGGADVFGVLALALKKVAAGNGAALQQALSHHIDEISIEVEYFGPGVAGFGQESDGSEIRSEVGEYPRLDTGRAIEELDDNGVIIDVSEGAGAIGYSGEKRVMVRRDGVLAEGVPGEYMSELAKEYGRLGFKETYDTMHGTMQKAWIAAAKRTKA